jgi:hypothetical protein
VFTQKKADLEKLDACIKVILNGGKCYANF